MHSNRRFVFALAGGILIMAAVWIAWLSQRSSPLQDTAVATKKDEHSSDDDKLQQRIFDELKARVTASPYEKDGEFARQLKGLPRGLKAMAATHWLDVSLTMDDIGWHFLNFGEPGLVAETEAGLRELGLAEMAEVFKETHAIVSPLIAQRADGEDYYELLKRFGHEKRVDELSTRAWAIQERRNIYSAWLDYAKKRPELVFEK